MPGVRVEQAHPELTWRASRGDRGIGVLSAWMRPDGRCALQVRLGDADALGPLLDAVTSTVDGELIVNVGEHDVARRKRYVEFGFTGARVEAVYAVPVAKAAAALVDATMPADVTAVSIAEVAEDDLHRLDDELRHDVPGTDGWRWSPEAFRDETFGPHLDPELYLVAVARSSGDLVGIGRVWVRENRPPRLGLIGVTRVHRRRGVARGLLALLCDKLAARSVESIVTEVDVENVASTALMHSIGAVRIGGVIELSRRRDP